MHQIPDQTRAIPDHLPSVPAIWTGALLSSLLGAAILFDAQPGINWPIWVASASVAVILSRAFSGLPINKPVLILLGWATLLALAVAITDSGFIRFLVIISDAMLLGLAVIVTGAEAWRSLSVQLLPTVPFLAPIRVWLATFRESASAPERISSARARPVVRGLFLTVPIVIALIALLRNADPVIAWAAARIGDFLPDWSFSTRVLFFLFLLSLTVGANAISARHAEPELPSLPRLATPSTIGITERRMVLVSVGVILWLFVLLQVSYLFRSPPSMTGSGVTFAEYARKGFAELSVAVTLVGGIILVMEATTAKDSDRNHSILRVEVALLIALELILLSAFRRVLLYEQAYGFTTTRLFAQAYMVVIALALIALWIEIAKGSISVDFGRRVAVIALGAFTILAFWNYEGWIVDRNIDRSLSSGKFDSSYAVRLSRDAIPTLVARRAELPLEERAKVEERLACTRPPADRKWFEFNLRYRAATSALASARTGRCTNPERDQGRKPV